MIKKSFVIATASLLILSDYALASDLVDIKQLCAKDSLNFFEALSRNNWALRCSLISRRTYDWYVNDDYGNFRTRLTYPVFTKGQNFSDWFAAPRIKMAPCNTFGYSPTVECVSTSGNLAAKLLFAPGELSVFDAYTQQVRQLVVVDEEATLDNLHYREETVSIDAKKAQVQQVNVVTIHTQSGKTLTVTQDHPLLLSSGILKNAQYLNTQDALIAQDGSLDNIASVATSIAKAQLYNTQINTLDAKREGKNQLVVTQGFLSGYLAPSGEQEMGQRLALRDSLPESLIR